MDRSEANACSWVDSLSLSLCRCPPPSPMPMPMPCSCLNYLEYARSRCELNARIYTCKRIFLSLSSAGRAYYPRQCFFSPERKDACVHVEKERKSEREREAHQRQQSSKSNLTPQRCNRGICVLLVLLNGPRVYRASRLYKLCSLIFFVKPNIIRKR